MLFYIGFTVVALFSIACIAAIINQYYLIPKNYEDQKKLDDSENSEKHQVKSLYSLSNPLVQEILEIIESPVKKAEPEIQQVQDLLNHVEEKKPLSEKQELYNKVMKDFDEQWYQTTGERSYIDSLITFNPEGSWREEEEMEMTSGILDAVGKFQESLTNPSSRTV